MKIERSGKMAEEVLGELSKLLWGETRLAAHVSAYRNGREHGLVFNVHGLLRKGFVDRSFTFSESRSSDEIVVYDGNLHTSREHHNDNDADAMYDAKRLFATPKAAAMFIAKEIKATIKEASKAKAALTK
jgi:hypothetical protein